MRAVGKIVLLLGGTIWLASRRTTGALSPGTVRSASDAAIVKWPAPERLWAEALNLGAWDVLAKPFEADEVIRIVSIAGQHWEDRHGVYHSRTEQRKSATGTGYLAATGT